MLGTPLKTVHISVVKKDKRPYHSVKKAHYLGDKKALQEFLDKNLVYPKEALEHKITGVSHVKCEVSDSGKVLKAEVLNKLGYGLDEEAVRLCKLMRFENTTERGLKIKHTTTMRIPFVLPKPVIKQDTTINVAYQVTPAEKPKEEKKDEGGGYGYTLTFE